MLFVVFCLFFVHFGISSGDQRYHKTVLPIHRVAGPRQEAGGLGTEQHQQVMCERALVPTGVFCRPVSPGKRRIFVAQLTLLTV